MTAMERSISHYEERGSEASMADSLGIKDAAKESSKGQNFKDADYVHGARGVHPEAIGDNREKLTCDKVAEWLRTLSRISNYPSLFWCAEKYAHRLVVDEELTKELTRRALVQVPRR